MNEDLHAKELIDAPIIIVGESLPENPRNISKILDKKGSTYNSIILPLKYYMNEYLIHNHKLKLPYDWNNNNDIFRFVNAIENPQDKCGLGQEHDHYSLIVKELKEEILDCDGNSKFRMIICMGDFSYFATRTLFGLYHGSERQAFPKSRTKFTVGKSGEIYVENPGENGLIIFPILHNVSNLKTEKTINFLPESKKNLYKYTSYLVYVAKEIADIIINDSKLKSYLITL